MPKFSQTKDGGTVAPNLLDEFCTLCCRPNQMHGRHFRGRVSLKQRTVNLVAADVTFLTRPMPRAVIPVAELHRVRLS